MMISKERKPVGIAIILIDILIIHLVQDEYYPPTVDNVLEDLLVVLK